MDIIPLSESIYFYKDNKDQIIKNIFYNSDIQYKVNNQDSSLYIYYEVPEFDSLNCFYEQNKSISMEKFFIGTIKEYFVRDSLYPIRERNIVSDKFFKTHCKNEEK